MITNDFSEDREVIALNVLAVGTGGFIGAVLRYLIGKIPVSENTIFPIKTFAINVEKVVKPPHNPTFRNRIHL